MVSNNCNRFWLAISGSLHVSANVILWCRPLPCLEHLLRSARASNDRGPCTTVCAFGTGLREWFLASLLQGLASWVRDLVSFFVGLANNFRAPSRNPLLAMPALTSDTGVCKLHALSSGSGKNHGRTIGSTPVWPLCVEFLVSCDAVAVDMNHGMSPLIELRRGQLLPLWVEESLSAEP